MFKAFEHADGLFPQRKSCRIISAFSSDDDLRYFERRTCAVAAGIAIISQQLDIFHDFLGVAPKSNAVHRESDFAVLDPEARGPHGKISGSVIRAEAEQVLDKDSFADSLYHLFLARRSGQYDEIDKIGIRACYEGIPFRDRVGFDVESPGCFRIEKKHPEDSLV